MIFKRRKKFNSVDELRAGDKFFSIYGDEIKEITCVARNDKILLLRAYVKVFEYSVDHQDLRWFKELNS